MASPFTKDETTILVQAMDQAIQSAKRGQKSGKQPQISAAYEAAERVLQALKTKIQELK